MAKFKILILGSNGFIGRNLVDYFSRRDWESFAPKRRELDLLNTEAVESYLDVLKPDVVVMSAVDIFSVEHNLQMFFNLYRCNHLYGQMITIGSGAEYDKRKYVPKMDENYFGNSVPADTYGLSKFVVSRFVEKCHSNITNLRVFGIYGPHEDYTRRFISNNICRVLAGMDLSIEQDMMFDYIFVFDFIPALERIFGTQPRHQNYNLCANEPVSLSQIASCIQKIHSKKLNININKSGSKAEYSGDNSRFSAEFGAVYETPLHDSIGYMYSWYENHEDINVMLNKVRSGS